MGIIKNNQKGFGGIEAILIIVIVVLIGAVGYLVYKNHHKTTSNAMSATSSKISSSTKSTSSANPYTGWKSYSDTYFSFKYPSNWTTAAGQFPTTDVTLSSPGSTPPSYFVVPNVNAKTSIGFGFYTASQYQDFLGSECTSGCSVKAVSQLKISGFPDAKLVIYNSNGTAMYTNYSVENTTSQKVGDTSLQDSGLTINGSTYYFEGCTLRTWSSGYACAQVSNFTELEASSDYQNLVNVLNSLAIN